MAHRPHNRSKKIRCFANDRNHTLLGLQRHDIRQKEGIERKWQKSAWHPGTKKKRSHLRA
jgi:hypothetical protein